MKKFMCLLVAMFAMVNIASAKDDVVVTSGSLAELKDGAKVCVEWDYSAATIEGKSVKEFLSEKEQKEVNAYPDDVKNAEAAFAKALCKKYKKLSIVDKAEAEYIIKIKVGNYKCGSTAAAIWAGFGTGDSHLDANIEVVKAGASVIAKIEADGVPGEGVSDAKRRSCSYKVLGEWIAKLIKKA